MSVFRKLLSLILTVVLLLSLSAQGVFALSQRESSAFSLDLKDSTVDKADQDLAGKISDKFKADKAKYELYSASDEGDLTADGEVSVENGRFNFEDIKL